MSFSFRELEVFQPYTDEIPHELLWAEGLGESEVESWLSADTIRIAKLADRVMGIYAMDHGDGTTFILHGVIVAPAWRRQGLGRWLVGHAIGVAESKGGRHVAFPGTHGLTFFAGIGFQAQPRGLRYDLIPE